MSVPRLPGGPVAIGERLVRAFRQRAARSAVWTGQQRYGLRVILAGAFLVVLFRRPALGLADAGFLLLGVTALFLPLLVGPRVYAAALVLFAVLGVLGLHQATDLVILCLVLAGMAGSQLPLMLAVLAALGIGAVFALTPLVSGSGGTLLPPLSWLATTFAGGVAAHTRRAAATVQAATMAEVERSHAELRLAHEQLRLDSERSIALAAVEERERIAREIHDVLAHTLTVLVVQVGGLKRLVAGDPARAQQQLDLIAQLARDGLAEVRRSIHELRSPDEDGIPALAGLVSAFAERTGTVCQFAAEASLPALPAAVSKAFYRVIQEALTNAVRHGNAAHITVNLSGDGECLLLSIIDDGVGAGAAPPVTGGGNGLPGASERLRAFGGNLVTGPLPGGRLSGPGQFALRFVTACPATGSWQCARGGRSGGYAAGVAAGRGRRGEDNNSG